LVIYLFIYLFIKVIGLFGYFGFIVPYSSPDPTSQATVSGYRQVSTNIRALKLKPNDLFPIQGGAYMLQLMDTYCGGWAILIIGLMECVAVAWVYGAPRFMKDISVMTGRHPALWWRVCWQGISPALIVV